MAILDDLSPAELARQLANPEGKIGAAVAQWLNQHNRDANARTVEALRLVAGDQVLEIGFGNGRMAPEVIARAPGVRYSGVDISRTMVEEAMTFNAALVEAGKARFFLASADRMPFPDDSFERVFAMGVAHFWSDPANSLAEARRVLRPGGLMILGCLSPTEAPEFAKQEFGFRLRDAPEWDDLCRKSDFVDVDVRAVVSELITDAGLPIKRRGIFISARK